MSERGAQKKRESHSAANTIAHWLARQTQSWQGQSRLTVEQILEAQPELQEQPESVLDLVHNEIFCRQLIGEKPDVTEYERRFPEFAERIRLQWEVDCLLFSGDQGGRPATDTTVKAQGDAGPESAPLHVVPHRLGSYSVLGVLGHGGMGVVYLARHNLLGKTVALKVLSARVTERRDAVARFKREMRAVGTLNDPNIVQAYDAGEVEGVHYIAMEYVPGVDLHRLVKEQGPLSVADACAAVCQLASALQAAHQAGLVHRDVKPSNAMILKGQVKLLDLGLARLGEDSQLDGHVTPRIQVAGTPDFMAPEQWDDSHSVDHRADLYSLGCTLYFLLTGKPPYDSTQYPTYARKMKAHLQAPIPRLEHACPGVPAEVARAFEKLLAKSAADRFSAADEVRQALVPFASPSLLVSVSTESLVVSREPSPKGSDTWYSGIQPPESRSSSEVTSRQDERRQSVLRRMISVLCYSGGRGGVKQRVHLLVCVLTLAVLGWTAFGLQRERRNEMPPLSAASGHPAADLVAGGDPVASLAIASQNREQGDPARLPAALAEHRLELWRLITPAVVSDGRVSDVRVQDKLLILNASGRSRQIWLDFQEFRGKRLSAAMRLKCQQTDREGYFKIVFLPWRSFSGEYYLLISRKLGRTTVNLCFHDGEQEHPLAVSPLKLTSEPIDIRFNFSEEAVEAQIGSQIVLHAPTNKSRLGTPAIAVGGWEVELQKPVVILNE